jgi:hypothetical protein
MGQKAEFVVDRDAHPRLSGVQPAGPAGTALPSGHERAISATSGDPPAQG